MRAIAKVAEAGSVRAKSDLEDCNAEAGSVLERAGAVTDATTATKVRCLCFLVMMYLLAT